MPAKGLLILVLAIVSWLLYMLLAEPDESSMVFDYLRIHLDSVTNVAMDYPAVTTLSFAMAIVLAAAIGLPPPGLLAVAAGAVLGVLWAAVISLPATIVGSLVPFQLSRRYLGPLVSRYFPQRVKAMRDALAKDGAFYLFSLRLVPLVPFPLVNLFMGLTTISTRVFAAISLVGRVPLTILYCNAGAQIAAIRSSADIMTPNVVLSLAALALFPHLARWGLMSFKTRHSPPKVAT